MIDISIDVLNLFCNPDVEMTSTAWSNDKYTYVTDGHIAIRIKKIGSVSNPNINRPNIEDVIPQKEPEKWFKISDLPLPMPVICSECGDLVIPDRSICINEVFFSEANLYRLRFLPNCKIGPFGEAEAALLKFDGGIGALMPMRMDDGPRLTCAACGKVTDSIEPFCKICSQKIENES